MAGSVEAGNDGVKSRKKQAEILIGKHAGE
jgi:hypothetical protein